MDDEFGNYAVMISSWEYTKQVTSAGEAGCFFLENRMSPLASRHATKARKHLRHSLICFENVQCKSLAAQQHIVDCLLEELFSLPVSDLLACLDPLGKDEYISLS